LLVRAIGGGVRLDHRPRGTPARPSRSVRCSAPGRPASRSARVMSSTRPPR